VPALYARLCARSASLTLNDGSKATRMAHATLMRCARCADSKKQTMTSRDVQACTNGSITLLPLLRSFSHIASNCTLSSLMQCLHMSVHAWGSTRAAPLRPACMLVESLRPPLAT
jgi:hypothetical protein